MNKRTNKYNFKLMIISEKTTANGYQHGMRIPQPGFNSQRVPDYEC